MISEETKNIEEADREKVYEKKSKEILEKTLSFSELKLGEEIDYRPVKIFENDHVHEIYTINHESSHLPHMVMLHGFGGTAMTYVRMFKRLNKFYKVHALDSFGVGHSSFGSFTEKFTYEQTRDYFVDAI
jgi:pimeloyl-ACP methyl ester carboxylesterase